MRQWLLIAWSWLMTGVMAGFVISTFPTKPVTASPSPITVATSKPRCYFGLVNDVNNCGATLLWMKRPPCKELNSAPLDPLTQPPGSVPRNGEQCEICRILQLQVQGRQVVWKTWYDCNKDGKPDGEVWWGKFALKGCFMSKGPSTGSVLDPFSTTPPEECACPSSSNVVPFFLESDAST